MVITKNGAGCAVLEYKRVVAGMDCKPGTFEWAWKNATGIQQRRYEALFLRVQGFTTTDERKWLLWMAGQGRETINTFLTLVLDKEWK